MKLFGDAELISKVGHHKDEGKGPVVIGGKQFSRDEYQKMVERRRNGERTIDIAEGNGLSTKNLGYKFWQQGIHVEAKQKPYQKIGGKIFLAAEIRLLIEGRQSGKTVRQLATGTEIKQAALKSFFQNNDVRVETKKGMIYIGRKAFDKSQQAEIMKRKKNGESTNKIAKDFAIKRTTLHRFFVAQGIEAKNPPNLQKQIKGLRQRVESHKNPVFIEGIEHVRIGSHVIPKSVVDKMVEARIKGESTKAIASRNGIEDYLLRKHLKNRNVHPKQSEDMVHFKNKDIPKEKMDEIIKRRKIGEPVLSLAKELGVNNNSLAKFFKLQDVILKEELLRELNRKYEVNHDFFKRVDSQEKAYLLGLIMTDGNIHKEHNSIRLEFQKRDVELCEIARKSLASNVPVVEREPRGKSGPQVRIQVNSKTLCQDLERLGIRRGMKTYDNKFPDESVVPRQFQRDFIRGVIDGDGCVIKSHRINEKWEYDAYGVALNGTYDLVKGVQRVLVRDAGLSETKIILDRRTKSNYVLRYGGSGNVAKVYSYLYPKDFKPEGNCLQRKHNRMKEAWDKNQRGISFQ